MNGLPNEARDPFLGYLYQLRFALLRALRTRSPDALIAFELLDDVQVADGVLEGSTGLYQLKHSITNKASLGARSLGLWKTIGNWAQLVIDKQVDVQECHFFLHTTAVATTGSPCRFLRADRYRQPSKARMLLLEEGKKSTDAKVQQQCQRLMRLNAKAQEAVFDRIYVVDGQTNIAGLRGELEAELSVACHPTHLTAHVRQLEGWFFDIAILSLLPSGTRRISVAAIKAESARIRDAFVADSLPDEFSQSPVPDSELSTGDNRLFVRQLALIKASRPRVTAAQQDHYRAFAQRSQWSREGVVAIHELPRFDNSLIDEWQRRHEDICERCPSGDDATEIEAGSGLFRWAELDAPNLARLQLRTNFNAAFLIRGSFHVLADRRKLGWHPRFRELLSETA